MKTKRYQFKTILVLIFIIFIGIYCSSCSPKSIGSSTAYPTEPVILKDSLQISPEPDVTDEPTPSPSSTPSTQSQIVATATKQIPTANPTLPPSQVVTTNLSSISLEKTGWLHWIDIIENYLTTSGGLGPYWLIRVYPDLLSTDYSLMALIISAQKTQIISTEDGIVQKEFEKPIAPINSTNVLKISPNDMFLANGGAEERAYLWDIASGELAFELPLDRLIKFIEFSDNSQTLLVAGGGEGDDQSGRILVWNLVNGEYVEYPDDVWPGGVTLSSNGKYVAINESGEVSIWNIHQNSVQKLPIENSNDRSFEKLIAFSPDNRFLAVGVNGQVKLWGFENNREIILEDADFERGINLVFSPQNLLASWSGNNLIKIWDSEGNKIGSLESDIGFSYFEFTPDGKYLISFLNNGEVFAWELP